MEKTRAFRTDAARWEAVKARNAAADGHFFYSVKTTGVYCLPSCASRLAKRSNVGFHESREAAEAVGFRPCQRCRPAGGSTAERHAAVVVAACRAIREAEEMPRLEELAAGAGMSRHHFHRVFKSVTGVTPRTFAAGDRARRTRERLGGGGSVTEAIYEAGFNSNGRFYAAADEMLGMTPKAYLKGGEGEMIQFVFGKSSLGPLLVAASARGLCAILMGDDPEAMRGDLRRRFPRAELGVGGSELEENLARVVAFIEAPRSGFELPLDLRGTLFQQKVWKALQGIPAGTTASYAEIAKRIGMPKAVRAVAGACGANPLAVVVPCHRVVKSDGGISGYRWGVERKRALLEIERKDIGD